MGAGAGRRCGNIRCPNGVGARQGVPQQRRHRGRHRHLRDTRRPEGRLVQRGLSGVEAPLTGRERRRLVEFREALREIVAAHGAAVPTYALETVGAAARTASLVVTIDGAGQAVLYPSGRGLDALVARLLADIASAQRIGTWRDLRICRRDVCRWAFYDASRNHSRVWCTMSLCGNRVKSANLRRRRSRTGIGPAVREGDAG